MAVGTFLARHSHQLLGLQSAADVNAPALAVIFAVLTLLSTAAVTATIQYLGWNTLVIEQYALSAGFQAGSTCTCSAVFKSSDVVYISLTNESYYGLIELAVSPYASTLESIVPPGHEVTPDPLALVQAFEAQLSFINSRIYEVGSFTPDTFINSTTATIVNAAASGLSTLAAASAATTAMQNNLITPVIIAYAANAFYAVTRDNATLVQEVYNFLGDSFATSQQLMKDMLVFWNNITDPFASNTYTYNLTGIFDVNVACATASCVLIREPTSLERFQSIITLLTSTLGLCTLIAAVLVRQLSKLVNRLANSKHDKGLDSAVMELASTSNT